MSYVWARTRAVRPGFAIAAVVAVAVSMLATVVAARHRPCALYQRDPYQGRLLGHLRHALDVSMCESRGAALDGFLDAWRRGDLTARDRWLIAGADALPAGRADGCVYGMYEYRGRFVLRVESADRVNDPWRAQVVIAPSGDRLAIKRVRVERWQPIPWLTFSPCARPGDTILRTASFAIVVGPAGFH